MHFTTITGTPDIKKTFDSFVSLLYRLSQPDNELITEVDRQRQDHPQSTMLGAPLETATNLHSDHDLYEL